MKLDKKFKHDKKRELKRKAIKRAGGTKLHARDVLWGKQVLKKDK